MTFFAIPPSASSSRSRSASPPRRRSLSGGDCGRRWTTTPRRRSRWCASSRRRRYTGEVEGDRSRFAQGRDLQGLHRRPQGQAGGRHDHHPQHEGERPDKNLFEGGDILDPNNGKVYSAKLTLVDGGKKLDVRGYIGMPMLGRTQTWQRVE
jgi:hypothetical protein